MGPIVPVSSRSDVLAPAPKRLHPTGVNAPQLRSALEALPAVLTLADIAAGAFTVAARNAALAAANAKAAAALKVQEEGLTEEDVEVRCMARTRIPTAYGPVFLHVYHNNRDGKEHLAIVSDPAQLEADAPANGQKQQFVPIRSHTLDTQSHDGETAQERITRGAYVSRLSRTAASASAVPSARTELSDSPLVRIHSECFTGETLGSLRCDCGEQLDSALSLIAHAPGRRGIVLYLRQEGRGIGLLEKVRAYNLQDLGLDTVQANLALGRGEDERTYGVAAAMLRDLGVGSEGIRLLTNNPSKVAAMQREGIEVTERVPMVPRDWQLRSAAPHAEWEMRSRGATAVGGGVVRSEELEKYLRTKVERMGHLLELPAARA
ncbi:GTP cyclohydrolase II [Calocera cornea HHB12733]|uniref:GTP cyclohydrolase II n=1 Tax=Calocera cornea HHB12733 TaxID=1353952 RepID=A0A165ILC0_9BASI|nr:GTP cyclohydrolase II [Calocera cornea HHB12733]